MNFNFNKKLLAFLLLSVIVVLSLSWVISKKINEYAGDKDIKTSGPDKQILEIQEKTVKPVNEKLTGFNYTPLSESLCSEKSGQERKDCFDYLQADQAYALKNASLCLSIENKDIKYYCLKKIVRESRDVKICKMVDDEEFEKKCFHQIAFLDNKPELCEDENEFEKKECLGPILAFKAAATGKAEECKKINILEYSNLCFERIINNFNRDCRLFQETSDQVACQDIVLFEDAMEVNNIKLCDLIYDLTRKRVCQNVLNLGPSVDSDGDGLTDGKELWFTTDPFNPDTDGDGLSDNDEMKKYETNPTDKDSDGDGISDWEEVNQAL